MATEKIFSNISEAVVEDYEEYKAVLENSYFKERPISLEEFYRELDKEIKQIEEEASLDTKPPTMQSLIECFKSLDEFPDNIQKSEKLTLTKDQPHSTSLKSSVSLTDVSFSISNTRRSHSLSNLTEPERLPKASETFKDFKKFQKHLKQLNAALEDRQEETAYIAELQRLNHISQELDKLLPEEKTAGFALTDNEERCLDKLLNEINDANATQFCYDVLRKPSSDTSQRLEKLTQILSFCLNSVNSFVVLNY